MYAFFLYCTYNIFICYILYYLYYIMSSYMRDSRTPRFRCPRATPPKTHTQSLVLAYQMTQPSLGWSVIYSTLRRRCACVGGEQPTDLCWVDRQWGLVKTATLLRETMASVPYKQGRHRSSAIADTTAGEGPLVQCRKTSSHKYLRLKANQKPRFETGGN